MIVLIFISVSELVFAICEINLRASRAFCEIFVTRACWPYVTCRVSVHAIIGLRAALPASARSKQGTRRYEGARKRQERASCAPEWLACAITNNAEILPSQSEAEDRHREYPINENARLRQDRTFTTIRVAPNRPAATTASWYSSKHTARTPLCDRGRR